MSIDMKDYKESFNMMFGTNDISINLLSNPYFQFNVYEFDQKWNIKMSENIKLKQCQKYEILDFMDESATSFYPNSLCFEDVEKIKLKDNYFDSEFESFFVSIDAC